MVAVTVVLSLVIASPAAAATLVGEWTFDEGSGAVARDRSPSRLDGRLGVATGADGADPDWVAGIAGSALRFDGGDAVVVPDSTALEPANVTIEAWVRRQGTPGAFAYVVSKGSLGCDFSSYGLYTGAGKGIAFYVSDGSGYVVSPAAAPAHVWDGAWHHVAGTFDGHTVRLYRDGSQVGLGSAQDRPIRYGLASTAPYIGIYRGGCELGFTGDIDDIRIWDEALTGAAIAASQPTQPPAAAPSTPAASRSTLAPLAPVSGPPPTAVPACVVSATRTSLHAGRRTSLTVNVREHAKPLRRVHVQVKGKRLRLVRRTDSAGRARFVVRPKRSERRLTLRALGRSCQNTNIPVRR